MNNVLELLRDNLMIVLSATALILVVLIVVVSYIEKKNKNEIEIKIDEQPIEPKETKVEVETLEEVEMLDIETSDTPILLPKKPEIIVVEKNDEELKMDAIREIDSIIEGSVEVIEEDALSKFEKEQEDTAIISYEELKQKTEIIYSNADDNEDDAILDLNELNDRFSKNERASNDLDLYIQSLDNTKEELDIIVPSIYETVTSDEFNYNVNIELENTANLEKLDLEIRNATTNKINEEVEIKE